MVKGRLAFVLVLACTKAGATPPTVTVAYSETLDAECSAETGVEIKAEWKADLARKRVEFERRWAEVGPRLLAATERLTNKPFSATSITARLTLCDVPSENTGTNILVNMRYALASFTSDPVPVRYKANILFHEILHGFVRDHAPKGSPLLAEHGSESERVRDHLHLLALMKAAFLDQGLQSDLAEVIKIDGELPGGYYKRAWEIVNQTDDTYLKYVSELRGDGPKGAPPASRTGMVGNPPPPGPKR